jgi:uncharacterized membrane protein YkvI
MIFGALLESGTAAIHAINERMARLLERSGRPIAARGRFVLAVTLLVASIFVADRYGLVALIAEGYRTLSYVFLLLYVVPVMSYGVWYLVKLEHSAGKPTAP